MSTGIIVISMMLIAIGVVITLTGLRTVKRPIQVKQNDLRIRNSAIKFLICKN